MKKFLPFLLLIMLLLPVPRSAAQMPEPDLYLPLNIYQPVKVALNFVFTTNLSVVCNTVSSSYWFSQTSPTSIIFSANTTDIYTLTITVGYKDVVQQTMVLGIWSGNTLLVDSMPIKMNGRTFTLVLKISASPAPQYPSTESIVDLLLERLREEISALTIGMEQQQTQNAEQLDRAILYAEFASGLSVMAIVTVAILSFFERKRRREEK